MKRRFEFRLARLRRIREIDEQVARAAWSEAENASRVATAELARARAAVEDANRNLAGVPGELQPGEVLLSLQVIEGLKRAVHARRELALTRQGQAKELADAWREREVDRRALEQLEERARVRHREELERADNAEIDEQNLMREIRRRRRTESDSSGTDLAADTEKVSPDPRPTVR